MTNNDWGPAYWEANGFTPEQATALADFASAALIDGINDWLATLEVIGSTKYLTIRDNQEG